ncbi:MAG: hypothetical protein H0X26_03930 [Alphaproteobacteria bacterium]|nr:hypothetical protein [Alphaproteobacteria bacterium]
MFHIWSQIDDVLKFNTTPLDLALQLHPYTLRYALVYPCIFLENVFGLHHDVFYSVFVVSCWAGTVYLSFSMLRRREVSNVFYLLITTGYLLLLMLANGRGILALFGVMLFFFIQWRETEFPLWQKFLGLSFAFLLCSVSTGIFFCFSISLLLILMLSMNFKIEKLVGFGVLVFPILFCCSYVSFEKNIAYYGSITSMLDHGLPGMVPDPVFKWGMVGVILSFSYFIYYTLYKEFGKNVIILTIYVLGGLFGTLTFVVVIPLLLITFLFHYAKPGHKVKAWIS